MKKNLNRTLMLTAAVLTLGAAAAYGQSTTLAANVPFSFHIKGAELAAGNYAVDRTNGGPILVLRDVKSGKSVMAMAQTRATEVVPRGARLIFRCNDLNGCSLAEVWTGSGDGLTLSTPRVSNDQKERLAVVFLNQPVGQ